MEMHKKLLAIKLLHTLVWSFFVFIIFYIVYSGLTNKITLFTWIAIGLVVAEGLVLLVFKMFCPLTLIARKYSDSQKDNFDIFLPNWLAKYNKIIFTTIYIAGVILVLIRTFRN
ncbi:hypothetical protein FHG64_11755 [Antarcticibacterium flavum]|uniref:DUF2784 domain-containing protein n=1 Tax=Antarcticibacterium flavum TaxID=2058175 RepID=A0A5B7X3X6_9FLAO|nr:MULTISPECIES: hypothetical protein [Antarcticibacterium]MCM4161584.1 hypothetical protein [Antarcticibacterium sp. W02-3]QCY70019.1 hypothetical protein FHG64_11755 [Antarcticibacterium flavum]